MKVRWLATLMLIFGISISLSMPLMAQKSALEEVKVTFSYSMDDGFVLIFGRDKGFYRDEGIELNLIDMPRKTRDVALLTGQVDYTTEVGTPIITGIGYLKDELDLAKSEAERAAILKRGNPLRTVFILTERVAGQLMGRPEFPNLQSIQQANAIIGVSRLETFTHRYVQACFRNLGVDPSKFTFMNLGESKDRFQKLMNKTVFGKSDVAAAMLWPPYNIAASLAKYPKLVGSENCPIAPVSSLTTTADKVNNNPGQIKRMSRATLRTLQYILDRKNQPEIIGALVSIQKLGDQVRDVLEPMGVKITVEEYARLAYEAQYSAWSKTGKVPLSVMKELGELTLGPDKGSVIDPKTWVDFSALN